MVSLFFVLAMFTAEYKVEIDGPADAVVFINDQRALPGKTYITQPMLAPTQITVEVLYWDGNELRHGKGSVMMKPGGEYTLRLRLPVAYVFT
jgi:hypothetical protein